MRASLSLVWAIFIFTIWWVPNSGALTIPSTPKSFALFSVHYNKSGGEGRGGVGGTVFFVSPTRAVTAFHVANRASFKPQKGFERARLWLVHEGYRPIEIKPEYLVSDRLRDLTIINLPRTERVPRKFIFEIDRVRDARGRVTSEGFLANTTGPILERKGGEISITAVPGLHRLFAEGQILRQARVSIQAADLQLKDSPNLQLNYKPIVGMSGGPVIAANGRVIAMNSFAEPSTFRQTWALELRPGLSGLALP